MTEAEWLGADSPLGMLGWLCETRGPSGLYVRHLRISDRKLRLFACACCRAAWHLLSDKRSRRAVEASERLADGRVPDGEAVRVWAAAEHGAPAGLAWQCTWPGAEDCAWNTVHRLRCDGRLPRVDTPALLREVVGNPFRRPFEMASAVPHDPVPLAWLTPEVLAVARGGYDERLPDGGLDPARLAVLADALEDAGCAEEALPRHLRSPGPHYRGCWALDLMLGLS